MFSIIGVILLTCVFVWVSLYPLMFSLMCLGGFDEFAPIPGILFLLVFIGIWVAWWFLVGTHIDISIGVS